MNRDLKAKYKRLNDIKYEKKTLGGRWYKRKHKGKCIKNRLKAEKKTKNQTANECNGKYSATMVP